MDYFSGVTEALKKASVAFTEALLTVSSVLQNIAGQVWSAKLFRMRLAARVVKAFASR